MSNIVTANVVAMELRKLADLLDNHGELNVPKVWVTFHCDTKDEFVGVAGLMPRPFAKSEDDYGTQDYRKIRLTHDGEGARIQVNVQKSLTCRLVEPAKPAVWECEPILSMAENEAIS